MRFWDSSALVPLLVEEETTPLVLDLYRDDTVILTWWGTDVECASAIARLERQGDLAATEASSAFTRLEAMSNAWNRIEPGTVLRETAKRMLRVHDLRAGDALQLAAAVLAAEYRASALEFVCLDNRLAIAAQREGFPIRGQA